MSKSEITQDRFAAVVELSCSEFLSPANYRRMLRLAVLVGDATGQTRDAVLVDAVIAAA